MLVVVCHVDVGVRVRIGRLAAGLGEAVTVVFAFALALLFEFSAVLQAAPKTAIDTRVRKAVVFRILVPPVRSKIKLTHFRSTNVCVYAPACVLVLFLLWMFHPIPFSQARLPAH